MARIRTIKPEFFTSEDIVDLTPLARLFFIALWCEADREGRLKWKPRTLKMRYLPADDCDIDMLAQELIDGGLVVIYEGGKYAEIPSFVTHQVINNRESESQIPARVSDASGTRASRVKAEGKGKEGKGKEGKEGEGEDAAPTKGRRFSPELVTAEWREIAKEMRPDLDWKSTLATFCDHWSAKTGKDATKLDWLATWRNWLRREGRL